jgi:hypothetical protein
MRVLSARVLEDRKFFEIAAHAVQDDEIGPLLVGHHAHFRHSTLMKRDGARAVRCLQVTADIFEVR